MFRFTVGYLMPYRRFSMSIIAECGCGVWFPLLKIFNECTCLTGGSWDSIDFGRTALPEPNYTYHPFIHPRDKGDSLPRLSKWDGGLDFHQWISFLRWTAQHSTSQWAKKLRTGSNLGLPLVWFSFWDIGFCTNSNSLSMFEQWLFNSFRGLKWVVAL